MSTQSPGSKGGMSQPPAYSGGYSYAPQQASWNGLNSQQGGLQGTYPTTMGNDVQSPAVQGGKGGPGGKGGGQQMGQPMNQSMSPQAMSPQATSGGGDPYAQGNTPSTAQSAWTIGGPGQLSDAAQQDIASARSAQDSQMASLRQQHPDMINDPFWATNTPKMQLDPNSALYQQFESMSPADRGWFFGQTPQLAGFQDQLMGGGDAQAGARAVNTYNAGNLGVRTNATFDPSIHGYRAGDGTGGLAAGTAISSVPLANLLRMMGTGG